jgi:hypothetical protein
MDRATAEKIILLYDRTSHETRIRIIRNLPPWRVLHWYNFREQVKSTLQASNPKSGDLSR